MKKLILPLLISLFFTGIAFAQHREKCASLDILHDINKRFPGVENAFEQSFIQAKRHASTMQERGGSIVYDIPVVFHVLYNPSTPSQNIPDINITRQIEIMNRDFSATNADISALRSVFGINAVDAQIRFHLAYIDPQGNPTTGIERRATTTSFEFNIFGSSVPTNMKYYAQGGLDAWDTEKYMNIWVCDMESSILGVAVLGFAFPPIDQSNWPAGSAAAQGEDGLCIQYQFIGDNNSALTALGAPFSTDADKGRTVIHETGHYLGLRHIWGDKGDPFTGAASCTGDDDGINDTPFCGSNSQTTGCVATKNTCGAGTTGDLPDMWENYMDYSKESCQVLFTPEQVGHMRATLDIPTQRGNLTTWEALLSINNIDFSSIVHIAPNPAQHYIQIEWKNDIELNKFEIINAKGQVMLIKNIDKNYSQYIETSMLNNGIYTLRMYGEKGIATKKFIILK